MPPDEAPRQGRDDDRPYRFAIVVPVLDAMPALAACFDSVVAAARAYEGTEALFVDNGSTDGSREFLREREEEGVRVLDLPDVHVSAVRNFGAARTQATHLAFVDSDCVIPPDYLQRAAVVLARTGADATGCTYALPERPGWIERAWFGLHAPAGEGWVRYLNAGNFVCSREAFEAVDGFDPALETGEDAELCLRLRGAGRRIYEAPSVEAVHLGNPQTPAAFYRKQRWHAVDAHATFREDPLDKPLLMTLAHMVLTVAGIVWLVRAPGVSTALAALVAWLAAPVAATVFRMFEARRIVNPVPSVVLYHLYFTARAEALLRAAGRGVRSALGLAPSTSAEAG